MSHWYNYFLVCQDAGYLSKSHTVISSRLTFLPSDTREHVKFYEFKLRLLHMQ